MQQLVIVHQLAQQPSQVDLLARERTALIEPRQVEQVVDQHPHPLGFGLDPPHGQRQVLGPAGRAAAEQLGEPAHGGERGPQLVRGVGDEPAQPILRRLALRERLLDLAEHRVQRHAQPADLGRRVGVVDAP